MNYIKPYIVFEQLYLSDKSEIKQLFKDYFEDELDLYELDINHQFGDSIHRLSMDKENLHHSFYLFYINKPWEDQTRQYIYLVICDKDLELYKKILKDFKIQIKQMGFTFDESSIGLDKNYRCMSFAK